VSLNSESKEMMHTRRQSAQAVIELALVMPIMLWFGLGALDYGRAFHTYLGLTNAAREGARRATLLAPDCDAYVVAEIHNAVQNEQSDLSVSDSAIGVDCSLGDRRTVTISNYQFVPVTPFIGGALQTDPTGVTCPTGTLCFTTRATLPVMGQ